MLTIINCKPSFSFKYAVTRALNPTSNDPEIVTEELILQSKKYYWESSFQKFEESNNIALTVMGNGGSLYLPKIRGEKAACLFFDKGLQRFSVINNMRDFLLCKIWLLHLSEFGGSQATDNL